MLVPSLELRYGTDRRVTVQEGVAVTIVSDLRALPLFQGISEARLGQLITVFRPVTHDAGTVLFRPGDVANRFDILTKGEVILEEEGAVNLKFQLRPVAPLGELGAITNIPRSTTATATTNIEILSVSVGDLLGFFDQHSDIGFVFYKNLLNVVSDKVRRDRRLLGEMRSNIIRTQKAMKQMREIVLDAEESTISKPVFESLDALIDNNRRANYRVTPAPTYPAQVRLDDGREAKVLEISEGYVKVEGKTNDLTNDPNHWAGVLVLPTDEIVISGTVAREDKAGVVMKLDTLVDDTKLKLDDYVTRVQLLDYVV
jgi:CRP/FNR family transcriptional regulator, cyclic AMP receptor protein